MRALLIRVHVVCTVLIWFSLDENDYHLGLELVREPYDITRNRGTRNPTGSVLVCVVDMVDTTSRIAIIHIPNHYYRYSLWKLQLKLNQSTVPIRYTRSVKMRTDSLVLPVLPRLPTTQYQSLNGWVIALKWLVDRVNYDWINYRLCFISRYIRRDISVSRGRNSLYWYSDRYLYIFNNGEF